MSHLNILQRKEFANRLLAQQGDGNMLGIYKMHMFNTQQLSLLTVGDGEYGKLVNVKVVMKSKCKCQLSDSVSSWAI